MSSCYAYFPIVAAQPTDLTTHIPSDTYHQIVHTLRALLPPPATNTQEADARRDRAAIAHACHRAFDPVVAASAQALDCLRLAREYPSDAALIFKCMAQSAGMMRQAQRWRTALLRAQATRHQTREANTTAHDTAAQSEHRALGVMGKPGSKPRPCQSRCRWSSRSPTRSPRPKATRSSTASAPR
jgi:hypothetical protein